MPTYYDVFVTIEGQDCYVVQNVTREKADEAFNLTINGIAPGHCLTMTKTIVTKRNQSIETVRSIRAGM